MQYKYHENKKLLGIVRKIRHKYEDRRYLKSHLYNEFTAISTYLSVVCIVKDEEPYIKEWIDFHKVAGVEHIYIFNNGSTDRTADVIKPYVEEGYVSLIDFPGEKAQLVVYRYALKKLKKKTKWLAMIDADEFLFTTTGNLCAFLRDYEQYPAVGVNWIVFGTCGHETKPEGTLIDNYQQTYLDQNNPMNLRIKSIVKPEMVSDMHSAHFCIYKHGLFAVDENKHVIDGNNSTNEGCACTATNNTKKIRINHYWTKSKQELLAKCKRGYPDSHPAPVYEDILHRLEYPLKNDTVICEYLSKVLS